MAASALVALLSKPMFALAVVAVTVLPLCASVAVTLSWNDNKVMEGYGRS